MTPTDALRELLEGTTLGLFDVNGALSCSRALAWSHKAGISRSKPLGFRLTEQVRAWAVVRPEGILDAGVLEAEQGDHVTLSLKSAAIGDVLGITCVFMPSGFAVGVPPTPGPVVSPGGNGFQAFAYPEQEFERGEIWWLPKMRWSDPLPDDFMPDTEQLAELWGWRKRLESFQPDVRIRKRTLAQELAILEVA